MAQVRFSKSMATVPRQPTSQPAHTEKTPKPEIRARPLVPRPFILGTRAGEDGLFCIGGLLQRRNQLYQGKGPPMLVLSRKIGESVIVGDGVVVQVLAVRRGQIRLGITAPPSVSIRREELPRRDEPVSGVGERFGRRHQTAETA